MILLGFRVWLSCRWPVLRLVRVFGLGTGTGGLGGRAAAVTGFWAGQAAAAGGPQAASNWLIHAGLVMPAVGQVHGDVAAAVACDAGPYTRFCIASISTDAGTLPPGSSGAWPAS